MRTDSEATPGPGSVRTLIEQLALLTDELEGQITSIARIPAAVVEDRPYEGASSIRDLYIRILKREQGENLSVVSGLVDGAADRRALERIVADLDELDISDAGVDWIISRIIRARKEIVDILESAELASWSRSVTVDDAPVSLFSWVYRMALDDAEILREIGIQFYERRTAFGDRG